MIISGSRTFWEYYFTVLVLVCVPLPGVWQTAIATPKAKHIAQKGKSSDHIVPGVVVLKVKSGITFPTAGLSKGSGSVDRVLKSVGILSLRKAFPAARPLTLQKAIQGRVDLSTIYIATIGTLRDPIEVARILDQSGQFEYAEPKYISRAFATPNDSDYSAHQALYFSQINAAAGWSVTTGDTNVVIADVDGGTFWQHPDIQGNLWINKAEDANSDGKFEPISTTSGGDDNGVDDDHNGFVDDVIGWNFANNSNNPIGLAATPDNASHGTATASQYGAVTNNGDGMAGGSWNCRIMVINASSAQSDDEIEYGYEGIAYALANSASVINCSWGRSGKASRMEQDVIDAAVQAGALVVAAAGNDRVNNDFRAQYPASYRGALSVGAVNTGSDTWANFSDYGISVPVYAPGTDIWCALSNGSYGDGGSGTSFATPLTSALAGLVKSLHPLWNPDQIAMQIRLSSDSLGPFLGHGRINYGRALTESHAGVEVLHATLLTPSGNELFLPGDTVVLQATVKNIMFAVASEVEFTPTTSDRALEPLQGPTSGISLAAGDSLVLKPMLFTVGTLNALTPVLVRVRWTYNTGATPEHDATVFKVNLFPRIPTWDVVQSSTMTPLFSVCAVDKNILWSSGGDELATDPVVTRSLDGGTTWTDCTGNLSGVDLYCINAIDSLSAWVGSGDGKIFNTTNGGTSWTQQSYPAPQSPFIDGIKIFPDLKGFALGDPASGDKFVILQTTDGGVHWSHLPAEPTSQVGETGWYNSFCWVDHLHGWFGSTTNTVWRTTDGGVNWSAGTTPEAGSVAISFADTLHGMVGSFDTLLAVTSDGGSTWTKLSSPSPLPIVEVSYVIGTSSVWISDFLVPYLSTDGGNTWQSQTTYPRKGAILHGTFADTTNGWLVTSFGEVLVFRGTTSPTLPPDRGVPTQYVLEQNYPNPFNPSTSIRFVVPTRSRVSVTVYDILGRRIAQLVNGDFQPGTYEQQWRSTVSSGIYFYRIEAVSMDGQQRRFVNVKKMVLIK